MGDDRPPIWPIPLCLIGIALIIAAVIIDNARQQDACRAKGGRVYPTNIGWECRKAK